MEQVMSSAHLWLWIGLLWLVTGEWLPNREFWVEEDPADPQLLELAELSKYLEA